MKEYFKCPVCGSSHEFEVDLSRVQDLYFNWREYCDDDSCTGSVDYVFEKDIDDLN